ncbi:MAG: N-acetyltransferase [Caldilineaceae bacterium]|nr:N-acetyltransferase [Caldilineaceae bacterium]MCB9148430.1 N-acetyltransferase [Caldilineaceae bacterium]
MKHLDQTQPFIIIRLAQTADADAMAHVMVDTYLAAHQGQMPEAAWQKRKAEWTYEVSARSWRDYLQGMADGEDPNACVYVAEVADAEGAYPQLRGGADAPLKLVGVIMAHPAQEEWLSNAAEIGAVYVLESSQGLGIGRKLMQAAATHMQKLGRTALQVGVLTVNAPARNFYAALGGTPIGERQFDEEGFLLPEVVYGWPDIGAVV